MKIAVCPGSFDPVTYGHIDIFRRAAQLFDEVIVLVTINDAKKPAFSAQERVEMIKKVTADIPNLKVDSTAGLLVDYVKKVNASAIVKGLRAISDFEYEFQMALLNKSLYAGAETVFLSSDSRNMFVSSTLVKSVAHFGGNLGGLVPKLLQQEVLDRLWDGKTRE